MGGNTTPCSICRFPVFTTWIRGGVVQTLPKGQDVICSLCGAIARGEDEGAPVSQIERLEITRQYRAIKGLVTA